MFAIRYRAEVFIYIRNQYIYQPLAEARAGRQIPVAVIGEDDEKWRGPPGGNQSVGHIDRAKADPLVVGVGLAMEEIEDRIAQVRPLVVAWRQIDNEFLRWFRGINVALFHAAGPGWTGDERRSGSGRDGGEARENLGR